MSDEGRRPIYEEGGRRTGEALHDHEAVYDVFVDFIQGGLAQFALLSAPALWAVAVTPIYTVEIATAAGSALLTVPLLLTAFRGGHLSAGRPWPVLTNRRLGTTGWQAFLTRSVYLSSTLLFVTVGGVLAQVVSGTYLANVLVAGTLSIAALVALPFLSTSAPLARIGRFCYCLGGFTIAVGGALLSSVIPLSGLLAVGAVLVLAAADTRPVAAIRER